MKKSAGSASQCGDHPLGYFSPSGIVAHSSSWSPAAYGHGTLPGEDDCQETSSRTVTRRRRKKSLRCSTSPSTGSNSLAGDPGASAVTTWQAAVDAGGAARLRMASKSFTRHPFLEHFVDVPVLQITDEVDAAVKGSGEGGGGRGEGAEAKVAAVGVQLCSRCSSLALQGVC